jgi:mannose-6-phosphate isomerase-like protein (cupin superfamily)
MGYWNRRTILQVAALALPSRFLAQVVQPSSPTVDGSVPLHRDEDRYGPKREIANGTSTFKVSSRDCRGDFFAMEHNHTSKGGPPRHLHHQEDEWFYVLEGTYLVEVGTTMHTLNAGDSILGPRGVSHAFAFNGDRSGRLLITYAPAGRMEEYFDSRAKDSGGRTAYVSNAAKMAAFGMELLGPPIKTS